MVKLYKDTEVRDLFYWVAYPRAYDSGIEKMLSSRRYEIDIIGGVTDDDACYSYDNWALCKLDTSYYLLSTAGCSCPSPTETWRVEIGPATIMQIREHVLSGDYEGYILPKKQEQDFLKLLDSVKDI